MRQVFLPRQLRQIGPRAFQGCTRLSALAVPGSVEEIGEDAFAGCVELKTLELPLGFLEFSPKPALAVPQGVRVVPVVKGE